MSTPAQLQQLVAGGRAVRPAEEGIYTVLGDAPHDHLYDRRAAAYDLVVRTRLYNRVMWGNSPDDYAAFARRAAADSPDGPLLDAACGSLLFTARAHLECGRQVVAFDQSIVMLRRARRRLLELAGSVPENILLLQGDLCDLPFRPGRFRTVLCLNALHQLEDAAALVARLWALVGTGGGLYLTSLVTNDRLVGDCYLGVLHAAGEFVRPRSAAGLKKALEECLGRELRYRTRGNMAYASASAPNP